MTAWVNLSFNPDDIYPLLKTKERKEKQNISTRQKNKHAQHVHSYVFPCLVTDNVKDLNIKILKYEFLYSGKVLVQTLLAVCAVQAMHMTLFLLSPWVHH